MVQGTLSRELSALYVQLGSYTMFLFVASVLGVRAMVHNRELFCHLGEIG